MRTNEVLKQQCSTMPDADVIAIAGMVGAYTAVPSRPAAAPSHPGRTAPWPWKIATMMMAMAAATATATGAVPLMAAGVMAFAAAAAMLAIAVAKVAAAAAAAVEIGLAASAATRGLRATEAYSAMAMGGAPACAYPRAPSAPGESSAAVLLAEASVPL